MTAEHVLSPRLRDYATMFRNSGHGDAAMLIAAAATELDRLLAAAPSAPPDDVRERIVAVAVTYRDPEGRIVTLTLPPPARHHNILHISHALGVGIQREAEQGFITSNGKFVDREVACIIARAANQIIQKTGPDDTLFSEDLW